MVSELMISPLNNCYTSWVLSSGCLHLHFVEPKDFYSSWFPGVYILGSLFRVSTSRVWRAERLLNILGFSFGCFNLEFLCRRFQKTLDLLLQRIFSYFGLLPSILLHWRFVHFGFLPVFFIKGFLDFGLFPSVFADSYFF